MKHVSFKDASICKLRITKDACLWMTQVFNNHSPSLLLSHTHTHIYIQGSKEYANPALQTKKGLSHPPAEKSCKAGSNLPAGNFCSSQAFVQPTASSPCCWHKRAPIIEPMGWGVLSASIHSSTQLNFQWSPTYSLILPNIRLAEASSSAFLHFFSHYRNFLLLYLIY